MKRRVVIRNLVLLSAGAAILDSCGGKEALAYRNIPLTPGQQDLLSELSEFILPATPDFVGAKDLHADEFSLMMVDDCGSPEDQAAFLDGLGKFDEACAAKTNSKFTDATAEQRTTFLNALEMREGNDQPENVVKFYRSVKRLTIQSFTSSEQYLTQVRKYSLIPPKFQGCVPVEPL
jgi:hypothetical protein